MSATGDETCPVCGDTATKVFSPVGVAFKGTGFHNTDYRPCPNQDASESTESAPSCAGCPSAE
jgi:predicted nucleic acid-binding Zn ribbon protein